MEQQQQIQNFTNVGENVTQPAANTSTGSALVQSPPAADPPPSYSALYPVQQAGMQVGPQQMAQSQSLHNVPLGQPGSQGVTPSAPTLHLASSSHAAPAHSTQGQSPESSITSQSSSGSQSKEQPPSQPPQSNAGAPQHGLNPQLQAGHLPQGNSTQMQSYPQPLSSAQQGGMPLVSQQEVNPLLKAECRLADCVIAKSSCDGDTVPCTYILDLKPHNKKKNMIQRYTFGKPPRMEVVERVLMVVGATGAGKSTLINGMINYVFGVRWGDKFRFKMIVEKVTSQSHSVTQKITAYTIYHHEGSPINYTLTIIDTPGFGDTRGLRRDKEIITQIKEFFSTPVKEGGVDHLDAIGFVTQASLARLTPTQRYVFDSILSVFGKDIQGNIFMMITFADGNHPPVVDAIKEAKISYTKYFKFNNSAVYPCPEQMNEEGDNSADEETGEFNKMFWEMGMKSFKHFFHSFKKVTPQSLQLTNEVLMERQRIETMISGLRVQINEGLAKIDELHRENQILKAHETDILTNKDFKYHINVTKQRMVNLEARHYVTNCLVCNRTCHESCIYSKHDDKWQCSAMNGQGREVAKCRVCPGQCHWKQHVNNPYYFEIYEEEEERTQEDLKRKYAKAVAGKSHVQTMIDNMEARLTELDESVMQMINQVQTSLQRLDEIALKPNPLTEVEYIDLLIDSEKLEHRIGWRDRVQYYEAAREQAIVTAEVRRVDTPSVQTQGTRRALWKKVKGWWSGACEAIGNYMK